MTRRTLAPDEDVAAVVRGVAGDLTLIVAPGRDPLSLAQTRAAVAPLAIERAPARLNAVFPARDAEPADVESAAAWLDGAASTTGQAIDVSAS